VERSTEVNNKAVSEVFIADVVPAHTPQQIKRTAKLFCSHKKHVFYKVT